MCTSLRPYTYLMRSNVNLGSFGVTGVKRSFSAKCYFWYRIHGVYLYVTQCIYVAHKYALTWDSLLHSMGQGQLEITSSGRVRHLWWQMCLVTLPEYPAGYCILLVSFFFFFFFFLLLATLPRLIASTCPDRFPPNLVTRTPDSWHLCHLTRMGVKGHVGVTGVKKVKNLKTLLLLQITGYDHVTHVYASAWPLLQKLSL